MKLLSTAALLLFFLSISYGQGYKDGYLTYKDDSTLLTKIELTPNAKGFIKFLINGKTKKVSKKALKDYGTIRNGKKVSDYANSAFKEKAYDAYYILKKNNDTIPFYFLKHEYSQILGYLPTGMKLLISPKNTKTVIVKNGNKKGTYDGVDTGGYTATKTGNGFKFLKRIADGKIVLYQMSLKKKELKYVQPLFYSPDVYEIPFEINKEYLHVYVFNKDNQIYFATRIDAKTDGETDIKMLLQDYPPLGEKIGQTGYEFIDTRKIINEYNALWQND